MERIFFLASGKMFRRRSSPQRKVIESNFPTNSNIRSNPMVSPLLGLGTFHRYLSWFRLNRAEMTSCELRGVCDMNRFESTGAQLWLESLMHRAIRGEPQFGVFYRWHISRFSHIERFLTGEPLVTTRKYFKLQIFEISHSASYILPLISLSLMECTQKRMTLSILPFLDDKFYWVTITKQIIMVTRK